jgi:hypothetical protein
MKNDFKKKNIMLFNNMAKYRKTKTTIKEKNLMQDFGFKTNKTIKRNINWKIKIWYKDRLINNNNKKIIQKIKIIDTNQFKDIILIWDFGRLFRRNKGINIIFLIKNKRIKDLIKDFNRLKKKILLINLNNIRKVKIKVWIKGSRTTENK